MGQKCFKGKQEPPANKSTLNQNRTPVPGLQITYDEMIEDSEPGSKDQHDSDDDMDCGPVDEKQEKNNDRENRLKKHLKTLEGKQWSHGSINITGEVTDNLLSLSKLPPGIKLGWGVDDSTGNYYYAFFVNSPAALSYLHQLQTYPKLCLLPKETCCDIYQVPRQSIETAAFVLTHKQNNPHQMRAAIHDFLRFRLMRYDSCIITHSNACRPSLSCNKEKEFFEKGRINIMLPSAIERQYNTVLGVS